MPLVKEFAPRLGWHATPRRTGFLSPEAGFTTGSTGVRSRLSHRGRVKVGASAVKPTLSAVVLDSSPVWLEAVDDVLSRHGVAVVGRTREADRALELVDRHRPGLLIADSGAGGIECVREASTRVPGLKAIALGSRGEPREIQAAFRAGAAAFVVKAEHGDSVETALPKTLEAALLLCGSDAARTTTAA